MQFHKQCSNICKVWCAIQYLFCRKFCSESTIESILKIDQFFAKISTWVGCLVFLLTLYTL